MRIPLVEYTIMKARPGVCAFTTTRRGGASTGAYASLNCTPYTGDDPECVQRNRRILMEALPVAPRLMAIPRQVHGNRVLHIGNDFLCALPSQRETLLQGIDALTTQEPGVCICISTADCIPILLYDTRHRAAAAIHAGWRGTALHIAGHAISHMHACYGTDGQDLVACIGPGISRQAFEVGDEVYEAFRREGFPMEHIASRHPATRHWHIDLPEANRHELLDFGVPSASIEVSGICTYGRHEDFFSARRLGIQSGRLLTGIMLEGEGT